MGFHNRVGGDLFSRTLLAWAAGTEVCDGGGTSPYAEAGGYVAVSVYDRARLQPGDLLAGPAIMEEPDSTTLCPPGYTERVDQYLNLHINRG